jgi:hypothetical protein
MKRALLVVLALSTPATADDKATAETLFLRAKQLEKDGDAAGACPLYEASYRADPGLGALLNTANCHEAVGKTGTAWAEFREAAELAARRSDPRAAFAQRRATALEPRLVRLRVEAAAGVTVRRETVDMTAVVGEPLVLDPGQYTLAAEAPGHRAWSSKIDVSREGETITVRIPALERIAEPPAARTPVHATRSSSSRRTWAFVVGGAGVAVAATGLAFGGYAYSEWRASTDSCDGNNVCNDAGRDHIAVSRSAATKSTLLVAGGGALVATALVLWWTAPRTEQPIVSPLVDGTTAGVSVSGDF